MELLRAIGYLDIIYSHLSTRFFPEPEGCHTCCINNIKKYVHNFRFENRQKVCRIDLDLGE